MAKYCIWFPETVSITQAHKQQLACRYWQEDGLKRIKPHVDDILSIAKGRVAGGRSIGIQIEFAFGDFVGCSYAFDWYGYPHDYAGWSFTPSTPEGEIDCSQTGWSDGQPFRNLAMEVKMFHEYYPNGMGYPFSTGITAATVGPQSPRRGLKLNPIYSKPHPFFSRDS